LAHRLGVEKVRYWIVALLVLRLLASLQLHPFRSWRAPPTART
jgi:hypothetical protein